MNKPKPPPPPPEPPQTSWPMVTKREFFAACAMNGMIANGLRDVKIEDGKGAEVIGAASVVFADALIEALGVRSSS